MTDRDILQVSEPPVQYYDAGYGYSWKYAGRWYPYDPSVAGAREAFEKTEKNPLIPVSVGAFLGAVAALVGGYNGNLAAGLGLGAVVLTVYTLLGLAARHKPAHLADDWSSPAD